VNVNIIKWTNVIEHCGNDITMLNAFEEFRKRLKYIEPWKKPQDIIESVGNSDLITCKKTKESRVVFNIGSNKYRMICGYYFGETFVALFVKFVVTHTKYDKVDVCSVNLFKSKK